MTVDPSERGATPAVPPELGFLAGGGAATALILARDWSDHPLGTPDRWPEALKVSLSLILNSPESMILSWGRDELFFFFNETYFPLLGPRLDWAMGAPFVEVWADGWAQAKPIIDDAYAGRSTRFVDLPWKLGTDRGSPDTFWTFSYSRVLDRDGEVAGLFILTNETTERVLTDRALARSQDELRALNDTLERQVEERTAERDRLWELSPDLMVSLTPEAVYKRVNPAWTTVLGFDRDELVGKDAMSFVHPDDLTATGAAFEIAREGTLPSFENRFRHRDGSYRWIQWVAAASPEEIFAVGRHVTQAKEAEARLRDTEDQLRQAQKMEAVGQLTGGIAHDFNNILTGIIGSLDWLKRRFGDLGDARVARYIEMASMSAQRAAGLTHRLLAFSRRQSLDVRATDVNALVVGLEDLFHRSIGENISLELQLAPDVRPARTDANQLESALLNLAINARDAMPDGGRLIVSTSNVEIDAQAGGAEGPDALQPGRFVALGVTDTGTGMTPEVEARAFDPFFTTKAIGAGTGLGLSMIYGFVRQSGGHVRIDTALGVGTKIELLLPVAATNDRAPGPGPVPRLGAKPGESILLVEDDVAVRMLVADLLADLGYTVAQAGDATQALATFRAAERIDLLVTDVGLPGMNGRDLAAVLRRARPDLKVLFVSGYAEQAAVRGEFLEQGMELMAKPFDIDELSVKIREMLGANPQRSPTG